MDPGAGRDCVGFFPLHAVRANGEADGGGIGACPLRPIARVPHKVQAVCFEHSGVKQSSVFPVLINGQNGLGCHVPASAIAAHGVAK